MKRKNTQTVAVKAKVTKRDLQRALRTLDSISSADYGLPLSKLLSDDDARQRRHRIRHLIGVAIKQDFSKPEKVVVRSSAEAAVKWKIDPIKLHRTPDEHWALQLLQHSPSRRPGESAKDLALRLHREAFLFLDLKLTLRQFICDDPASKQLIELVLADIGLGDHADKVSMAELKRAGVSVLATALTGVLPPMPALAVAFVTYMLCNLGLGAVCSAASAN